MAITNQDVMARVVQATQRLGFEMMSMCEELDAGGFSVVGDEEVPREVSITLDIGDGVLVFRMSVEKQPETK